MLCTCEVGKRNDSGKYKLSCILTQPPRIVSYRYIYIKTCHEGYMTFRLKALGKLERMDTETLSNFATQMSECSLWGNRRMNLKGGWSARAAKIK